MEFILSNHSLVKQKISTLRDKNTKTALFRKTVNEIASILTTQITNDLKLEKIKIETPIKKTYG